MKLNVLNYATGSGKLSKSYLLILLLWLLSSPLFAQNKEIGAGIGTMNYVGDLPYKVSWHQPAATVFYRNNLSPATSVKYSATFGRIKGNVEDSNALAIKQNVTNEDVGFTYIGEGSVVFEYNFLDYSKQKGDFNFTPYLFGGAGFFYMANDSEASNLQAVIPFGIGVKQMIGKQWNLGVEAGLRKTFTDRLDSYNPQYTGANLPKDYYGNDYNKDYYYFIGFNLSYTFYDVLCP
jgi:hypothetical protein